MIPFRGAVSRRALSLLILSLASASLLMAANPATAQHREPAGAPDRLAPLPRDTRPVVQPRPEPAARPAPLRPGGLVREEMKQLAPLLKGKATPEVVDKPVRTGKPAARDKGAASHADLCKDEDFSGFYDGKIRIAPVMTFKSSGDTGIAVYRLAPGVTAYEETLTVQQRSVLKRELVSGQDPAKAVKSLMRPGRKIPDAVKQLSVEHAAALKRSGQPGKPPPVDLDDDAKAKAEFRDDIANVAASMAATIRQRKCLDVDWNSVENVRKWKKMEAALDGIAADPFKKVAKPTPQDREKLVAPGLEKPDPLQKPEIAEPWTYCPIPCEWHEWWDQNYGKNYQHNWGCVDNVFFYDRVSLNTFDASFLKDQKLGNSLWMTTVKGWHLGWDENYPFFIKIYVDITNAPGHFKRLVVSVSGANRTRVMTFAQSDEPCVFFNLGFTVND
jgi:hypothetical protein